MKSHANSGLVRCVGKRWVSNMSKIGDILDKKVAVTFSVSQLVMLQQAMRFFDFKNVDERLIEETVQERGHILASLEEVLDREFPVEG